MKNCIYYFTGTGNSYAIAKAIAEKLEDTELKRITNLSVNKMEMKKYERVGIVYPVYWGSVPKIVLSLVDVLKNKPSKYYFSVATCGGMSAGSEGQLEKAFKKNGLLLHAAFEVIMTANNQTSYPPASKAQISNNVEDSIIKVNEIYKEVVSMKQNKVQFTLMSAMASLISKFILSPKSDRYFSVDKTCNNCGVCEKVCPANNIKLVDGVPNWLHRCYRCTACLQLCPQESIQFKNKTGQWGRYHHPEVTLSELMINQEDN